MHLKELFAIRLIQEVNSERDIINIKVASIKYKSGLFMTQQRKMLIHY